MKLHKMFCVDEEVVDFLKGKNASGLVNGLLHKEMDERDLGLMSKDQLQIELDCNKLERETKKKLKEMRKNAK